MSKIKVLMIDDNISLVEMVKEYFKENQFLFGKILGKVT